MSLQIDSISKINLEEIIRFPDSPDAHIKSYEGKLGITGKGLFERAAAYLSGSYFKNSVEVIELTCSQVLTLLSKNTQMSPEDYQLIEDMQRGLSNIKKVYRNRYGENVCIAKLKKLEENIAFVRRRLKQPEDLEEWAVVPKETFKVVEKIPINAAEGQLPGKVASMYAGLKTAALLGISGISANNSRARVLNSGLQFQASDVHGFIDKLGLVGVAEVYDFYLEKNSGINIHTFDQIRTILDRQIIEPGAPIIIPINFMNQETFGRNHIAVIVIKDNIVEYYDAKGVFSQYRQLADKDHTLRDVLAYCQKKWTKEGQIIENPNPHQTDANNCGMFVCHRIEEIFKGNVPLGKWESAGPSFAQIQQIRRRIADLVYPRQSLQEKRESKPSMAVDDVIDDMLNDEPLPIELSEDDADWVKA